jgi:hypothetical protein
MICVRRAAARTVTRSVTAVLVAFTLAGCSIGGTTDPKVSSGSTTSPSTSGALKDESAAVLAWIPPAAVAKTEGKLGHRFVVEPPTVPATAEIISVQAGHTSTVLTWQLSAASDNTMAGFTLNTSVLDFPDAVRLVDPVGRKSYGVNTMTLKGQDVENTYCACSIYPTHVGPDPVRMTSAYPPLPATITSISVRIPYFAPVTVPVTR